MSSPRTRSTWRASKHGVDRFEVLEYWGMVDTEILEEQGVDIPKELEAFDELQANVWICNNKLLRMVLNPFKPARIPYQAVPYELNPYSFFGVGIAENMDDTQTLMNGFMRMAVDNAVLSGNLLIEVDETNLVPNHNDIDWIKFIDMDDDGIKELMVEAANWDKTGGEYLEPSFNGFQLNENGKFIRKMFK